MRPVLGPVMERFHADVEALFSPSARIFIPMTAGLAAGTALLISAVIRYNR